MSGSYDGLGGTGGRMGDVPAGSAEVRSDLHTGGRGGDDYQGIAFAGTEPQGVKDRAADAVRGAADTVKERAGQLGDRAKSVAGSVADTVSERAGSVASQARTLADRAQATLENKGVLGKMRENPLPAIGIAFAVGFLLAGTRDDDDARPSRANHARRELRGALLAGLSAGVAQGARSFLRSAGAPDGVVNSLVENLPGLRGTGGSTGGGQGGYRQGGGTTGRSGGTQGSRQHSMSGSGTSAYGSHRPPSHQENL